MRLISLTHKALDKEDTLKDSESQQSDYPFVKRRHLIVLIEKALAELEKIASQHRQLLEILKEAQEILHLALSGSHAGIWYTKLDMNAPNVIPEEIYLSPSLKMLIGFEDHDFPNSRKAWLDRIYPQDLDLVLENEKDHLVGRTPLYEVKYRIYHRDGSIRWLHSRGMVFRDANLVSSKFAGITWDITQNKNIEQWKSSKEEHLKSVSKNFLNKLEAERRHIARELHDEIGQALTAIKITLQSLKRFNDPLDVINGLDESIRTVEKTIGQVRDMSLNLRPSILDDIGLISAIRWIIDRVSKSAGIQINFMCEGLDSRPPIDIETTCFRIVQEATNNIVRHAKADEVNIVLTKEKDWLHLEVSDNGIGFNVDEAIKKAHEGKTFGILGMKERAELLEGSIEIKSEIDRGTKITVRFPLSDPKI